MNPSHIAHDREKASRWFYNRWASTYDHGRMSRWFQYTQNLAIKNLKLEPDSQVLDVGCGTGYAVLRLAAMLPEGKAYGIDISSSMINKAGSKVPANLQERA